MFLGYFSLAIITLFAYIFLYMPIAVMIIYSFNVEQFPAPWKEFSLKWYYNLFSNSGIWDAFFTSIIIAVSTIFICLLLTLGLIIFISRNNNKFFKKYLLLFYGNLLFPEIVLAVGLLILFSFLRVKLGIFTLIVGHTVLGLGYMVPLIYARFNELDTKLIEASLDLGATKIQTFFKVTLPLLKPSIIAASLLVFIISFDDFLISFFCSGNSVSTLSLYIFSMIRSGISPVVNALSTLLLLFSSALVLGYCSMQIRSQRF